MAWKLSNIKTKVRRLTGRPSTNQISESDLTDYINNYYQQELLDILYVRQANEWFNFATLVNIDEYDNLPNNYVFRDVGYANGDKLDVYTDSELFFDEFPQNYQSRESVGTGDGSTTNFTGTLNNTTISRTNIVFDDDVERITPRPFPEMTAITQAANAAVTTSTNHNFATGDTVMFRDISTGMVEMNNLVSVITVVDATSFTCDEITSTNFIQYDGGGNVEPISKVYLVGDRGGSGSVVPTTGAFDITFNTFPADGQDLVSSYEVPNVGQPTGLLFTTDNLVLRPVPDGTYDIRLGISKQPDALSGDSDVLEDNDWGKLLAYGAAIDILNDYGQQEIAAQLQPQFDRLLQTTQTKYIRDYNNERSVPSF